MITTTPNTTNLRTYYSLLYMLARGRGGVRHSNNKGAYIWNSNGREVADAHIQGKLDVVVDDFKGNVERLSDRLESGNLSIADWQERMRREIKDLHRTQYIVGKGGVDQMTPRDWGRLGSDLRWMQYRKLDGFALDIADGKLSPAQISARSKMYMDASNKQYWRGKTEAKIAAGYIEEQRFLGSNTKTHCDICKGFARQGRVSIGTLPEPGTECDGKVRCRCTKVYYKAGE